MTDVIKEAPTKEPKEESKVEKVAKAISELLTAENVGIQPTIRYTKFGLMPSFELVDLDQVEPQVPEAELTDDKVKETAGAGKVEKEDE